MYVEPNIEFEFGQRYQCFRSLEHFRRQKILSFLFCFLFRRDKHAFFFKDELCFQVQRSLSKDFRIRIMPF